MTKKSSLGLYAAASAVCFGLLWHSGHLPELPEYRAHASRKMEQIYGSTVFQVNSLVSHSTDCEQTLQEIRRLCSRVMAIHDTE